MKKKTRTIKTELSEGELNYLDQFGDLTEGMKRGVIKLRRIGPGRYEMTRKEKLAQVWVSA